MAQLPALPVEIHAMLLALLPRFRRAAPVFGASTRTEVCPPALFRGSPSRWSRMRSWLSAPVPAGAANARQVRAEFVQALDDVPSDAAAWVRQRAQRCGSMRELWHLRAQVYNVVACHHSQAEAERRIAALNRHFPTRSPRSGFAPLAH
jgi:hypothetical protein